jgi:transposase
MLYPVENALSMIEQSLNLKSPWYVRRAEFSEQDRAVHIYIEGAKTAKYPCPVCGKSSKRYDDEDEERVWRHGDVMFFPCYVHCRRPRIRCEEHGIHVVEAPWSRPYSRNTLAFESCAMLLVEHMSLNEASRLLRISRTALEHLVEVLGG